MKQGENSKSLCCKYSTLPLMGYVNISCYGPSMKSGLIKSSVLQWNSFWQELMVTLALAKCRIPLKIPIYVPHCVKNTCNCCLAPFHINELTSIPVSCEHIITLQ